MPHEYYKQFDFSIAQAIMYVAGLYVLPTQELIDWLRTKMIGMTIEIGCGTGAIGRGLGIPFTDSKLQAEPDIVAWYLSQGQIPIVYPPDVEKLTADEAISKYNPNTVVGAFITHKFNGVDGNMFGVVEEKILGAGIQYINIGNEGTHVTKPILNTSHSEYQFDWLITRSVDQKLNRIWIWNEISEKTF